MAKKKPTKQRTARRAADRAASKLADQAEKLFLLSPGGSPERPIEVASASQVEVDAESHRCPRCQSALRNEEHTVLAHATAGRLRVAHVRCTQCRWTGRLYFRLPLMN